MELNLEHYREWIGRHETTRETVTPQLVSRFNATFDLGSEPHPGDAVAPMLHLCLALQSVPTNELSSDGHAARGGFLPPVPLPQRMWAGGRIVFGRAIRVGDTVERSARIENVQIKQGKSGTLCFVTIDHQFSVDGEPVVQEKQDIVYRGESVGSSAPAVSELAESGEHRRTVAVTTSLLFRYSALTFNGHRIHYDRPYATGREGYPGLVVHGPLQASLLVHFAAALRDGETPKRFDFRSVSALFDDSDFDLHANDDGERMRLWTAAPSGPVAMSAEASW
ncbi:MAG: MaoC family dehydratase N-terminal domain-containing protein [Pseudomonadota bacterium]